MTSICWFRTDLRIEDQPALSAAAASGSAIGLFIISEEQWAAHQDAPVKVDFWLRALKSLSHELATLNIPLKLLTIQRWKDIPFALLSFAKQQGATSIHCNREYGLNERNRDRASYKLLKEHGIELTGHLGTTLLEPGTIKTGGDSYYRVFTPFARACRSALEARPYALTPAPAKQVKLASVTTDPVPATLAYCQNVSQTIREGWPASEAEAHKRLEHFSDEAIYHYQRDRDIPSLPGTSTLSPYLAAGLVSAGQCLYRAMSCNQGETGTGKPGVTTWITELLWREFYQHLLHGYPELSKHQPMRPQTNAVLWRDAPDDFAAWTKAETGVPLIDAAMRQLLHTGWMHNRLRMVVAMYLTKNMLIDWRRGEAFFMRHLIDGELAANNGGWQWSASTGADSAPYFRVFNPISQSERFDPKGAFIKHWLPELTNVSPKEIHDPLPLTRSAIGYPMQRVDLRSSRLRAIEAFSSLIP
jgi:deoxyribodipyrimidine photo-lyase